MIMSSTSTFVSSLASSASLTASDTLEVNPETFSEVDDIIIDYTKDEEAPAIKMPETTTEEADEE